MNSQFYARIWQGKWRIWRHSSGFPWQLPVVNAEQLKDALYALENYLGSMPSEVLICFEDEDGHPVDL